MDFYAIYEGRAYDHIELGENDEVLFETTRCMPEILIHPRATYDFVIRYLKEWAKTMDDELGHDIIMWHTREFKMDGNGCGKVRFVANGETIYCRYEKIPLSEIMVKDAL